MIRTIAFATFAAGTLDILYAMLLTVLFGRDIGNMLRYVGSGAFPQASEMGATGATLGWLVHFVLMVFMASIFVIAAHRIASSTRSPVKWGVLYGLVTYAAMNLLIVPFRFDIGLPLKPMQIATQLFAHIVLVGIPIAVITARSLQHRPAAA